MQSLVQYILSTNYFLLLEPPGSAWLFCRQLPESPLPISCRSQWPWPSSRYRRVPSMQHWTRRLGWSIAGSAWKIQSQQSEVVLLPSLISSGSGTPGRRWKRGHVRMSLNRIFTNTYPTFKWSTSAWVSSLADSIASFRFCSAEIKTMNLRTILLLSLCLTLLLFACRLLRLVLLHHRAQHPDWQWLDTRDIRKNTTGLTIFCFVCQQWTSDLGQWLNIMTLTTTPPLLLIHTQSQSGCVS